MLTVNIEYVSSIYRPFYKTQGFLFWQVGSQSISALVRVSQHQGKENPYLGRNYVGLCRLVRLNYKKFIVLCLLLIFLHEYQGSVLETKSQ